MIAAAAIAPTAPALCRGRTIYADEAAVLAALRESGATVGRKLGAYPCGTCGGWHPDRRRWLR